MGRCFRGVARIGCGGVFCRCFRVGDPSYFKRRPGEAPVVTPRLFRLLAEAIISVLATLGLMFAISLIYYAPRQLLQEASIQSAERARKEQATTDAVQSKLKLDEKDQFISQLHDEINRKYSLQGNVEFLSIGTTEKAYGTNKKGVKLKTPMFQIAGTVLTIGATIRNLGQPTIVERYRLAIQTADHRMFAAIPEKIPPGQFLLGSARGTFAFSGKEALYAGACAFVFSAFRLCANRRFWLR